ncbi:MAG: diaminopimelate decarboxylase [Alphaproteobacteria bacterium]|nr:diaminopimelate decarboxylase [Alphaproteobacteria bacterium]
MSIADPMDLIAWRQGEAHVEGVALSRIAQAHGTPTYVYSRAQLVRAYRDLARALDGLNGMICYAVKANGNLAVVRSFAELGAGADVVSVGEMKRALQAGIPAGRIVFAGVGKTRDEIDAAIDAGIHQFNVESEDELKTLSAAAAARGQRAAVALRVNPDVDAGTHEKITTGRKENKFGIDIARAPAIAALAARLPGIAFTGLALHIGSQLTTIKPYRQAFARLAELTQALRARGIAVERLDLGGGIGIAYQPGPVIDLKEYATAVAETVGNLGCSLVFEPGRALVGNAGLLLTRVIRVKEGDARRFLVVDAAMNDLVRPALYGAFHAIRPVLEPAPGEAEAPVDVVGPICESSDLFAAQRPLPPVVADELLAILSCGAYGFVMASTYNLRPLPAEVMVDGDRFALVRPRQSYDDMLGADRLPEWMTAPGTGTAVRPRARGAA